MPKILTAEERANRAISEAAFQRRVCDYATLTGWHWWHNADSRRTQPGVPDLMLLRRDRAVWLELKRELGRATPEQELCIDRMRQAGLAVFLVRPSDWPMVMGLLR